MIAAGDAFLRTVIHQGIEMRVYPVFNERENKIVDAVAVQVRQGPGLSPPGKQFHVMVGLQWIRVDECRGLFPVVLAVAEDQVDVSVSRNIELVDPLQHTALRYIQVLTGVAEASVPKCFESFCHPAACF